MVSAPLSVVKTTMVLSSWPMSSSFLRTTPMLSSICFMPASLMPQSLPPGSPTMAMYLSDSTVVTCMRAGLYQTKKGLFVFLGSLRSRKSIDLGRDFLVHGLGALQRQRTLVLAGLVLRRAVGGLAPDDRARRGQAGARPWDRPRPGTSERPGIGVFLHGGTTPCSVGVLLMSGKLTPCIASR